jgi:hypothetical protein
VFHVFLLGIGYVIAEEKYNAEGLQAIKEAWKERDVETPEKLKSNFEDIWGKDDYIKNTGNIFILRAVGGVPIPPRKMVPFGDYTFESELKLFCQARIWTYLKEEFLPNREAAPRCFVISQNIWLSDLLYWEWNAGDVQFRKLETGSGMILSIVPKGLDVKKGISDKELANILFNTTKIPLTSPDEVIRRFSLPSVLLEGMVFSNVENLNELVEAKALTIELQNKFPRPRDIEQWSDQLVGFISKDAICLIIEYENPPVQVPEHAEVPLRIIGASRWLSGRILKKDGKTPVLPHGAKEIPESWKAILEHNAENERRRLQLEELNRTEESKWRVWYDKDGKPLYNGEKMKFDCWYKLPIDSIPDFRYNGGVVRLAVQEGGHTEFPLSLFSKDDKKQIMSIPSKKLIIPKDVQLALPIDEEKPVEPVKDDIE